jgi:cobalamin synthase
MESTIKNQSLTQTFNLLKFTFVIVPIVAGADKFANVLTNWEQYINPSIASMLPFSASVFMMIVGVIEIVAGVIVLKKAEIGGYIVAAWLTLIALTLLIGFNHVDVAVRDLVMAISAFSMARISKILV